MQMTQVCGVYVHLRDLFPYPLLYAYSYSYETDDQ